MPTQTEDLTFFEDAINTSYRSQGLAPPQSGDLPGPVDQDWPQDHKGGHHNPWNQVLSLPHPDEVPDDQPVVQFWSSLVHGPAPLIVPPPHPPGDDTDPVPHPGSVDDQLDTILSELSPRLHGYEMSNPNLGAQVVTLLQGIDFGDDEIARQLMDELIARIEEASGHVSRTPELVRPRGATQPGSSIFGAPWTMCQRAAAGAIIGTAAMAAVAAAGATGAGAIPAAFISAFAPELIKVSITALGENGCGWGSFW
ncbi:hypothetical protein [Nocardioides sp.]|uniref:hypothetical protein n=1 Tax=Nocardioides sp. TaxID=35761 RepID=UPI00378408DC